MLASAAQESRSAEDCQVVALRAAAGEHYLAWLALEYGSRPLVRGVEESSGFTSDVMDARRVAIDFAEEWHHRLAHGWVERCRGIVVEVNAARRHCCAGVLECWAAEASNPSTRGLSLALNIRRVKKSDLRSTDPLCSSNHGLPNTQEYLGQET